MEIVSSISRCVRNLISNNLSLTTSDTLVEHLSKYNNIYVEKHNVETVDGWKLTLHRVRHKSFTECGSPVLLLHGMMETSLAFFLDENSLGMMLLNSGVSDVWLANNRGNEFTSSSSKNWTFEDMSKYDLPSFIEYINKNINNKKNIKNNKKITIIAQSQGAAHAIASFSMNFGKNVQKYVKKIVLLGAPIVAKTFPVGGGEAAVIVPPALKLLNFASKTAPAWLSSTLGICALRLTGLVTSETVGSSLNLYFSKCAPSGSPALCYEQVKHWMQILGSGQAISRPSREPYPLETVSLEIDAYFGELDAIVDIKRSTEVLASLKGIRQIKVFPGFSHVDIVIGKVKIILFIIYINRSINIYKYK
eukprot:GHVL01021510.1.p1 GENE.GHVL01021510.1~~GHVL01021510.1.p1  ORF type:complete len:363 (-),score=80.22 GHVL01021510.1:60-1148(-)